MSGNGKLRMALSGATPPEPMTPEASLAWWNRRQLVKPYSWLARAKVGVVSPEEAQSYGQHRSAVIDPRGKYRTFAFQTREDRDRFCAETAAKAVDN